MVVAKYGLITLAGVLMVAIGLAFIPLEKAATVHNTIIGTLGKVTVQEFSAGTDWH